MHWNSALIMSLPEYDYDKEVWQETENIYWRSNKELNSQDWANTSAWDPDYAEFPIGHDYLAFQLFNYELIQPSFIPCEDIDQERRLMFQMLPYSSHCCHLRRGYFLSSKILHKNAEHIYLFKDILRHFLLLETQILVAQKLWHGV